MQSSSPDSYSYFSSYCDRDDAGRGLIISNPEKEAVLHNALVSLYRDQIRPHQVDVLRRLQENNASQYLQLNFLQIYDSLDEYYVTRQEGAAVVFFRTQPGFFKGWVDPNSTQDVYSEAVWQGLLTHIASLMQSVDNDRREESPNLGRYQFKGGRYGMAVELSRQQHAFLEDLSLGHICHLIQLAISRGVLAYERSVLQPVAAVRKAACAAVAKVENKQGPRLLKPAQISRAAISKNLGPIKRQIKEILSDRPNGVILSRLNREFWGRYNKKIDPTAFGFTKMSDFLLSDRLKGICRVSVNRRNHVIVQSTQFRILDNFTPLTLEDKATCLPTDYWRPSQAMISWCHWVEFPYAPGCKKAAAALQEQEKGEDLTSDPYIDLSTPQLSPVMLYSDEEEDASDDAATFDEEEEQEQQEQLHHHHREMISTFCQRNSSDEESNSSRSTLATLTSPLSAVDVTKFSDFESPTSGSRMSTDEIVVDVLPKKSPFFPVLL